VTVDENSLPDLALIENGVNGMANALMWITTGIGLDIHFSKLVGPQWARAAQAADIAEGAGWWGIRRERGQSRMALS
jgi:hypothetical protein